MKRIPQLHPDWPTPDPVMSIERPWSWPSPYYDFLCALDRADALDRLGAIRSVERYSIEHNGGGTELSMGILGRIGEDEWFILTGWNDYTGWGCQDGASFTTYSTLQDAIDNGLTNEERTLLGFPRVN